jgi:hypothetical protein
MGRRRENGTETSRGKPIEKPDGQIGPMAKEE